MQMRNRQYGAAAAACSSCEARHPGPKPAASEHDFHDFHLLTPPLASFPPPHLESVVRNLVHNFAAAQETW